MSKKVGTMKKFYHTYSTNSEGMVDTLERTDDNLWEVEKAGWCGPENDPRWEEADLMPGRWAHVREAHYEEAKAYDAPLRDWEETPDYTARAYSAVERDRRFMALSWWLERKRVAMIDLKRRGKTERVKSLRSEIEHCANGIKARYSASVKLILSRGQNEWWLLYLKREQKEDLLTLARDAYVGR